MSDLRRLDMMTVDTLFEPDGSPGYVLNFSDRTFGQFFAELGIDIDDKRYHAEGGSKGKRLRYFLKTSDNQTVEKVLVALWEYRTALTPNYQALKPIPDAEKKFESLLGRVQGVLSADAPTPSPKTVVKEDKEALARLAAEFLRVSQLQPHARGFEFERFLKKLFGASGLDPRASFRLVGEQIDGSFTLANETYLLEAKWQSALSDAAELRAFNAKVEDKAAWSRGLFVSMNGFSQDGLVAFGRAKRLVCMDGRDVCDVLQSGLSLGDAIQRKVRYAAESGNPYVSIADLKAMNMLRS